MFVLQVVHRSLQEAPKLWLRVKKEAAIVGFGGSRTWTSVDCRVTNIFLIIKHISRQYVISQTP